MEISFSPRNNLNFHFFSEINHDMVCDFFYNLSIVLKVLICLELDSRLPRLVDKNTLGGWSLEIFVGWVLVAVDLHVRHVLLLGGGCCVHLNESLETNIFENPKLELVPQIDIFVGQFVDQTLTLIKLQFYPIRRKINFMCLFLECTTKNTWNNWTKGFIGIVR